LRLSIKGWYLVHGLALCKTIHELQDEKRQDFAKMQISTRKDVDKCFGVLQSKIAFIQNPLGYGK
jgi:hypothetical protein